jgi:hypothetical protein
LTPSGIRRELRPSPRRGPARAVATRAGWLLGACALLVFGTVRLAAADTHGHPPHAHGARPDAHAPIGVMGEHAHPRGEWMFSYRYMQMVMRGQRDGTSSEGASDVFARGFVVSPKWMRMEMHMLGLMYAPTDSLTLMTMLPLVRLEMDHVTAMGGRFTTNSDGLGDVGLSGIYRLARWSDHELLLNAGVTAPTGTTTAKDDTPMGRIRLPYPMQLGSGTWDLLPGLTLNGRAGSWSYGAQTRATLRLGRNRHDYRLGNRLMLTSWLARRLLPELSGSLRVQAESWGNIRGQDDAINPDVAPTGDPKRRAGSRVDVLVGLNWVFHRWLPGHRLAIEYGLPVYQRLDGPQLETRWRLVVGWQKAFD